jgi:hypothetical protein
MNRNLILINNPIYSIIILPTVKFMQIDMLFIKHVKNM